MKIFKRLFGKKESNNNKEIKTNKTSKKTSIRTNSKANKKRELNQKVFEEFIKENSHYFNLPIKIIEYGYDSGDKYISKGGSIELLYRNRDQNKVPSFTIYTRIETTYGEWKGFYAYQKIHGKFHDNWTDRKLLLNIKKIKSIYNRIKNLPSEEELKIIEDKKKKEKKKLNKEISIILNEFDNDNDGTIDFNQGKDDFMNLLKKHQATILEIDQKHITKFIQVSNYLKTKRENIQKQFEKIKKSKNIKQLKDLVGILKNQLDTFNLLSYNSMLMIISLAKNDHITFNEIYLTFDKLNIFNSNWENEVSNKLESIDSKLDDLMLTINNMELSIKNEILKMSIMNQIHMNRLNKSNLTLNDSLKELNTSLSSDLKNVGSKLNLTNLLTGIQTYQMYKINKTLKH